MLTMGSTNMSVCISDVPSLWERRTISFPLSGSVFVVIPQRNRFVGPIQLEKLIAHKIGVVKDQALQDIEEMKISLSQLPHFRSEAYEKAVAAERRENHIIL